MAPPGAYDSAMGTADYNSNRNTGDNVGIKQLKMLPQKIPSTHHMQANNKNSQSEQYEQCHVLCIHAHTCHRLKLSSETGIKYLNEHNCTCQVNASVKETKENKTSL